MMHSKKLVFVGLSLMSMLAACGGNDNDTGQNSERRPRLRSVARMNIPASCLITRADPYGFSSNDRIRASCIEGSFSGRIAEIDSDDEARHQSMLGFEQMCAAIHEDSLEAVRLEQESEESFGEFHRNVPCNRDETVTGYCTYTTTTPPVQSGESVNMYFTIVSHMDEAETRDKCAQLHGVYLRSDEAPAL